MVKSSEKMKRVHVIAMFVLLSSTLLGLCHVNLAKCLPANSMWVEPDQIILTDTVGHKFNVTIYTNLTVASYAWQFYLTYNKNHLNATGCWYSAGAKSEWAGTRPTSPQTPSYGSHNATHNYILFAESLQGAVETPPGKYSLAIVEFQIIAAPPEGQTYQSQIRLDIQGAFNTYILNTDLNEIPPNYGGSNYIIDEFTAILLIIIMPLISVYMALLKRKFKASAINQQIC